MFYPQSGCWALAASLLLSFGSFHALASPLSAEQSASVDFHLLSDEPQMPYDENTIAECTWWYDNDGSVTCTNLLRNWGVPVADFLFWNPSLTAGCGNFLVGRSYCIEAPVSAPPAPTTTTATTAPTTTTRTTSTTTTTRPTVPTNGIETPVPTKPDMVTNCDRFHLVEAGETCADIARDNGITLQQIITWNKLNSGCIDIWAEYWVCIHIVGLSTTTTTTTRPTTTTATKPTTTTGNGINTPLPTQPSMVPNCDKFYFVTSDDTCTTIAARNGVTVSRFISWNKSLTTACTGLWANAYVCVRTIGFKPTTQSTCSSSDKTWGDNKPKALEYVQTWCRNSGSYATGQTKTGCYNAPFGTNKIQFWARNDFTVPNSLSVALCNEIVKVPVNNCERGGTGVQEGWWVR
ncbi:uncharacterized protein B0I36DRAFT_257223 [Microdochium trichocladiopsis]|uniref:LysM domain-containing protein n=1 Tax=Microdochium trichocladiopsis TaxID=1682393 RepID=A0A9P9BFD4_9PEZI|nr:uncharacterized protein B0I36DRAFT_257223 [Microdochium trichocladiopsis]KAH7010891.1 hypothetical protein B0I36DRAFT_257223 [Microdochium trichocladiopsis]